MSAAKPLPAYNEAAVRRHVATIHLLAKGVLGEVVTVGVGEDPTSSDWRGRPGRRIPTQVRRYAVGDIEGTVAAIMAQQGRPHANAYMPYTVVRLGLEPNDRGGLSDINAVLALTVDFDLDKGEPPVEPPIAPSTIIESSPGNRQLVFHLDRPLTAAEAEPLAKALRLATNSDSGTGDVSHVWRCPGAWNWPNLAKVKRGRPLEPVPVRVLLETPGRRVSADELRTVLAPWLAKVAEMDAAAKAAREKPEARPPRDDEPPIDLAALPANIRELIETGLENGQLPGDRSGAFHKTVLMLHAAGHSAETILDLLEQHPGGIAGRYDGRLADGIGYTFDKAEAAAQAKFDAAAAEAVKADDGDSECRFRLALRGVERRVETTDRATGETTVEWRWLCSHLEVAAHTRDADGDDWGRLLVIRDRDGRLKEWAMPMELLAGDGLGYRQRLLSLGLTMAPGKAAREALHEYVSTARPSASVRCVSRIGWHGRAFALPDGAVEPAA